MCFLEKSTWIFQSIHAKTHRLIMGITIYGNCQLCGVAKTDWSWGALLFDMDNDGYKDIYVCNGIYHDLTNQILLIFRK
jgi:hypothetical protein